MAPPEIRTPASIAAGTGLRGARERRKVGLRELARTLGLHPSAMSNLELGTNSAKPTTVSRILGCLRVKGAEYEQLMDLAEHTEVRNYVDQFSSPAIDLFQVYELLSSRIVEWAPFRIPDLLRMRGWLETAPDGKVVPAEQQLDPELFHQQCRQLPAEIEGRQYIFLIGDQALHMTCADTGHAEQQIDFLREVNKRKDVSIRVIPSELASPHTAGAFTVFENGPESIAIALRHDHCTTYLTDASLRARYRKTIQALLQLVPEKSAPVEASIPAVDDRA
jgi:transcriptional regulator with XRE-family HTH domain